VKRYPGGRAEAAWEKIVDDVTVYLTNMKDDFATYNRLWKEYFAERPAVPHHAGDQLPAHTDCD
jgi:2-aminomuconate deaminase